MACGAKLSERMVACMLKYRSAVAGMVLEHERRNWVVTPAVTLRWRNVELISTENGKLRRVA
jgi:hypothetical protein